MHADVELHNRRAKFPDVLRVSAPRGLRAKIKRIAEDRGVSAAEFVRSAVFAKIDVMECSDVTPSALDCDLATERAAK
ncbi:hypothetical protein SAMN05444581_12114 [Methylocapsa palsarum]|uniref:Ribbon-helix-helix protein, copG family n=2 Tax=Methylocapsa palsarum TaxID=1612308 RepID=A0A1I4CD19_9HYPH|nr:hypothetical protein SAMN05444581_12114 [Methylocapsa palsarum]